MNNKYICENCDRIFCNKHNLVRHQNKIYPCRKAPQIINNNNVDMGTDTDTDTDTNTNTNIDIDKNIHTNAITYTSDKNVNKRNINSKVLQEFLDDGKCVYCGKNFANKFTALRHIQKTCKEKRKIDEERDNIFIKLKQLEDESAKVIKLTKENKELIKRMNGMDKQILLLANKDNVVNNTINNNNTDNSTTVIQNIGLLGYGHEDIKKICPMTIINGINKVYSAPLYLTESIHFNEKYPEFHNVYIPNMKDKHAMKYDGQQWNLVNKHALIDKMYEDKKNIVEDNMLTHGEKISSAKKIRIAEWIENDNSTNNKEIKEEMQLLLYNKRNMVIQNKELIDKKKNQLIKQNNQTKSLNKTIKQNNQTEH